jgi:phosphate transport system permease protein
MKEKIARAGFLLCALGAVAGVLLICVYLVAAGLPTIWKIGVTDFLFGPVWDGKNGRFGILPFLLTSLAGTAGAVLLGAPVGVLTALFLAKVAKGRAAAVIRAAVSLLAGIPSVVYGLVGLVVLVPAIQKVFGLTSGATLLAAILVLAIMILPSVIHMAETALRAVPREYEEGSLALGATETQTIFRVSLPAARSGVTAALVLGVGRAMGEAMAVLMVSGNVANLPVSLFTPVRFLTTAITSEMSYATAGSVWKQALVSIGLVLFGFILLINLALHRCLAHRKER